MSFLTRRHQRPQAESVTTSLLILANKFVENDSFCVEHQWSPNDVEIMDF